ncbi:phosphoribosylformylglycinamidine synthase subunit PurL [Candidatus Ruminimicrobium bovinum]|uniref:phosphoribosylformylglycinamidine synthase subunit PurL n=1 Tax=Candidatus Ruminimicrobium bovinum TaxID=3242779 RepID=UPI0039B8840C
MTQNVKIIEIINLDDKQLVELSKTNVLSLSLVEMKEVQKYFKNLKRNPTDVELETVAQTWSEHCKHKTLTGNIEYTEIKQGKKNITKYSNLLKETIFKATKELDKPWCISVFKDNAGVIDFDDKNGVAFKVETHNHPSALEPYGGSATGIGGVIRDILGVGLGAKPLANTDVFCFGLPDTKYSDVPEGMHHPKRIAKGVVSGVRDYGNRMGIPTVNGAVFFDEGYMANPLVYCGTMGIIPKDKCFKKVNSGDLVLVVGGRTGRDGIHGATFSSVELDKESDVSAVQIGNPIVEKKVLDTMLKARDLNLYRAVTDCGAGGLSSAVGELGEKTGVVVELEKVPLKYEGLKPWEIWISEAQERMVFAVPPEHKNEILKLFEKENVEATFIGQFTDDKKLVLKYNNEIVADMDMEFLHDGVPKPTRTAVWEEKKSVRQKKIDVDSGVLTQDIKNVLADINVCSRDWIIRQYDHEVQGQTVIKPLQGNSIVNSGPSDASVIWPCAVVKNTDKAIVLSNGINPEYGKTDTYKMTASVIEEAMRNAVCVGADPEKLSLLDNFCWGNPNKPEILGSLVRATQACYDMSKEYSIPFISGKDSLYNEYSIGGKTFSIPPALLVSAMGVIEDVNKTVTMNLKKEGSFIYLVGVTNNELAGSVYAKIKNFAEGFVPDLNKKESKKIMKQIHKAILDNLVLACHDCSEGGFITAVSEMAFAGELGVDIDADLIKISDDTMSLPEILFSESNSRFIVEVSRENSNKFEDLLKDCCYSKIGKVISEPYVLLSSSKSKIKIKENIKNLQEAWQKTLQW